MQGIDLLNSIEQYKVEKEQLVFWWLGQLGYVIRMAGCTIYADPFLSELEGRLFAPPFKAEDVRNADIVLGSHDHVDHIDYDTWMAIAKSSPQAVFVLPELLREEISQKLDIPMERLVGIDDGKSVVVKGVTVHGIAAAHERLDRDDETGRYPYMSYIVSGGGKCFYHSGDTCVYEGMLTKLRRFAPFHVMFVPINGRDAQRYLTGCIGNMTFQEAVDLCGELKPSLAVPGHYDMFAENLGNPLLFKAYLEAKYPGIPCWIGERGEAVEVQ